MPSRRAASLASARRRLASAPHPTHSHLEQTLAWIARVSPRRAVLTHMDHTFDYRELSAVLPTGVEPGQDGLVIELPVR
jgi:phosphoribosyl 1,2-cyclic phosphate phosphodiesterase